MIDGRFALVDHHGRTVTDGTYRGRHVIVFFGFTHCRTVCPRALTRLSGVLEDLGPSAERITPLYISVDPERDTPEVMRAFLEAGYPRFTGLTGTPEQVAEAKRSFRVFSRRKEDSQDPDGYQVPHTAFTYLLDPDGRYVTHFADSLEREEVARRIASVLAGGEANAPEPVPDALPVLAGVGDPCDCGCGG